jgi:hypothetical protein
MALCTGSDLQIAQIKTLDFCSLPLGPFEGFFQKDFCIAAFSRATEEP